MRNKFIEYLFTLFSQTGKEIEMDFKRIAFLLTTVVALGVFVIGTHLAAAECTMHVQDRDGNDWGDEVTISKSNDNCIQKRGYHMIWAYYDCDDYTQWYRWIHAYVCNSAGTKIYDSEGLNPWPFKWSELRTKLERREPGTYRIDVVHWDSNDNPYPAKSIKVNLTE
jgi:hypothetical protein